MPKEKRGGGVATGNNAKEEKLGESSRGGVVNSAMFLGPAVGRRRTPEGDDSGRGGGSEGGGRAAPVSAPRVTSEVLRGSDSMSVFSYIINIIGQIVRYV